MFTLYTIPPLLSGILFLTGGIFVYWQNRLSKMHQLFWFACFVTFWWQFSWFILFNVHDAASAEILVKVGHIGIILLPIAFFHFFIEFLGNVSRFDRYFLYIGYLVSLGWEVELWATNDFINGFYQYFWGFYPKAGPLHPWFLVFLSCLVIRFLYLLLAALKKEKRTASYKYDQIKYVLVAMIFYVLAAADFAINYGIEFYPFGFLCILIFLGIVAYAILRHHLFNVKVIAAEALTFSIWIFLLARVLLATNTTDRIIDASLFGLTLIIGVFLVRSVIKEVHQKERLEKLTVQLQDLTNNLQQKVDEQTKEIKKAYEVEKQARLELEELDKAKDQFILTTQHHLRTPLTIIQGFLGTVLKKKVIKKKIGVAMYSYLQKASYASERVIKLVNDFLGISELEVGKAIFTFRPDNVYELIQEISDELHSEVEKKKLMYQIAFASDAQRALASLDKDALKAAFMNLIDNAIKYTNKGSIKIQGSIVQHPIDKASLLHIEIKDTGIGMNTHELRSVFRSYFQRGEEAEKMYTTGRGIGLVLSKNIIKAHHGTITANSEGKDKGSCFIIELPVRM